MSKIVKTRHLKRFSNYLSVLIASLIPFWSENMIRMISVLSNLLRCVLWPRKFSILVNIPYKLKDAYATVVGIRHL